MYCLFTSYNFRKAKCEDFKLTIEPNPQNLFARTDYFGNTQYYFSILKPHKVLQVIATSIVAVFPKVLVATNYLCTTFI
jgi:transglutaminase-like putative cysteine protease